MLNVDTIKNGLVIDHIHAGLGWKVFKWLKLDSAAFTTALIMNANSKKSGKKDIIKIDSVINIDYSILGFIDSNITVNVIQNGQIARKIVLSLPDKVESVIRCKNPRCITTTETYITPQFRLTNPEKREYRCLYCDAAHTAGNFEV